MKKLASMPAIVIAIFLFSCSNSTETAKESTPADTGKTKDTGAIAAAPAATQPEAFKPFDLVEVAHTVKDYNKWRPAFDLDSVNRKASGLTYLTVGREIDKPNNLLVVLQAADIQKSKEFAASPHLKDVMSKNGVVSKPEIGYYHFIRFNADAKEKTWVVVNHKVKDFDAWLKVFDAEGTAARAEQGLYDAALARGVDDPNIVQIVFDVKDISKAKASIASEEKKKLMASAGVEGVPSIKFYKSTE